MALTYKIKNFDEDGSGNVLVGFEVHDDSDNSVLFIDKTVVKGSKSDESITEEAYNESQTQVNAWATSKSNIGKTWNPSSKTLS